MLTDAGHPSRSSSARRAFSTALLAIVLLLAAATLALAVPSARAASTVTVEISNFAFQPASVTIQVGDTVTWTNLDSTTHTATDTGSGSLFDGVMNQGESFSYTFTQPGTFNYNCTPHPEMTGSVVVQAGSQPGASQVPDAAVPPASATSAASGRVATALGGALVVLSLLVAIGGARWRRLAARP